MILLYRARLNSGNRPPSAVRHARYRASLFQNSLGRRIRWWAASKHASGWAIALAAAIACTRQERSRHNSTPPRSLCLRSTSLYSDNLIRHLSLVTGHFFSTVFLLCDNWFLGWSLL